MGAPHQEVVEEGSAEKGGREQRVSLTTADSEIICIHLKGNMILGAMLLESLSFAPSNERVQGEHKHHSRFDTALANTTVELYPELVLGTIKNNVSRGIRIQDAKVSNFFGRKILKF